MPGVTMTRRALLRTAVVTLGAYSVTARRLAGAAAPPELALPAGTPEERFDFETKGVEDWTPVNGQWAIEGHERGAGGKKVLIQRATRNEFNVIVSPAGPYTDSTSR